MCEPASMSAATMFYLSMATTAATTLVSMQGQKQAVEAQQQADAYNRENMRVEANNSFNLSTTQENLRLLQTGEDTAEKKFNNALEAKKARSTARVSAGEAGVSGISVDALMADFSASEGRYNDALQHNFENEVVQSSFNMKGYDATRRSRIASASKAKAYEQPNYLGAALRIGGGALDSYGRYLAPDKRARGET